MGGTARPKKRKTVIGPNNREANKLVKGVDQLAAYEELVEGLPKELRNALVRGDSPEQLYKKYSNVAAIRVLQILYTETDSGKALAAAKELLDRTYGKATEKKVIRHQLEDLSDKEIDAMILSELGEE